MIVKPPHPASPSDSTASLSSLSASSSPTSSSSSSSTASSSTTTTPVRSSLLPSPNRGAFIVLEGVDRCGKSTQTKLLVKHLLSMGLAAMAVRFPDRTTMTGQLINQYLTQTTTQLDDRAIHLLFSANRWEAAPNLIELLTNGTTIVCDRYAYSGVAFSSAKVQTGTNNQNRPIMSLDWCKSPDVGLPAPDAVIFLNMPLEEAEQRGGYGEERYEKRDLQERVLERFEDLRIQDTDDGIVPWHVVNANQNIEEVQDDINQIVQDVLDRVEHAQSPIQPLWTSKSQGGALKGGAMTLGQE